MNTYFYMNYLLSSLSKSVYPGSNFWESSFTTKREAVTCSSPQASATTALQAHMDLTQQNIFKNICHKSAEEYERSVFIFFTLMWNCCTPSELKPALSIIQSKQCIRTQTIQCTVLTHPPLLSFPFPYFFLAEADFRPTSISGLHEMQGSSVGQQ